MRALFAKLGILSSTLLPSHILQRDEGHVWTTPQDSVNGSFIFPRTYPLTLREGSSVNIPWSTTYENINLYFYQRGKVANSVQIVTNSASEWYQWEVGAEESNLTNPFVFRIVNAQGTTEEQNNEGFWSTSWYLTRDDTASESVKSLSSAVSSTSTTSLTASPSSATSSRGPLSTSQETKTEATAAPTTAAETHNTGVSKDTIIGLTVGLVVAGATIIAGLVCYLRKRKGSKDALSSVPLSAALYYDKPHVQKESEYLTMHEAFAQPPELQSAPPCYELPSQK